MFKITLKIKIKEQKHHFQRFFSSNDVTI